VSCELCDLVNGNIKTRLYYDSADIIVVDCISCGEGHPLIVLKRHTPKPTQEELDKMVLVVRELFGQVARIRFDQRKIQDHHHIHALVK